RDLGAHRDHRDPRRRGRGLGAQRRVVGADRPGPRGALSRRLTTIEASLSGRSRGRTLASSWSAVPTKEARRHRGRRSTAVAWSMLGLFVISLIVALPLAFANGTVQQDATNQTVLTIGFGAFMVVGALIVAHRPGNAIGWIFSAIALLAVTGKLAAQYAIYAYVARLLVPTSGERACWSSPGRIPASIRSSRSMIWSSRPGHILLGLLLHEVGGDRGRDHPEHGDAGDHQDDRDGAAGRRHREAVPIADRGDRG